MITSVTNPRIKHLIRLRDKARDRNAEGVFVAEGFRMFEEAPKELIREVYVTEGIPLPVPEAETVTEEVMQKISGTETPQGIFFVCRKPDFTMKDILERKKARNVLVLEEIQDPGNLGTIIRTAEGAGVRGVILSKGCVDLYNPKVVRATMGSLFRVPHIVAEDVFGSVDLLKEAGFVIAAAHLEGSIPYDTLPEKEEIAYLLGNEGNGLSNAITEKSDIRVRIPMAGELESLNVSVAAALLMYQYRAEKYS